MTNITLYFQNFQLLRCNKLDTVIITEFNLFKAMLATKHFKLVKVVSDRQESYKVSRC